MIDFSQALTLASDVGNTLLPFLDKTGQSLVAKMGADAVVRLWGYLKDKATGPAKESAIKLEHQPTKDNLDTFVLDLAKIIKETPEIAKEIKDILSDVAHGNTVTAIGDNNKSAIVGNSKNTKITIS